MKLTFNYFALISIALCYATPSVSKNLYRFKDENGRSVVRDFLPPDKAQSGYQVLNEKFQVIETVAPAKTKEELEAEARQAEAEKLKQAAIKKQKEQALAKQAADREMMRHYDNYEDIIRNRKSDLGAIDVLINVNKNTISTHETELATFQRKAAQFERQGKPVAEIIAKSIKGIQKKISSIQARNVQKNAEKEKISKEYAQKLARFKELKAKQLVKFANENKLTSRHPNAQVSQCNTPESCQTLWSQATSFVKSNVQLPIEVENERLLLTQYPEGEQFSFSLTQIPDEEDSTLQWIVFDAHCASSVTGTRICQSKQMEALVQQYKGIIQ